MYVVGLIPEGGENTINHCTSTAVEHTRKSIEQIHEHDGVHLLASSGWFQKTTIPSCRSRSRERLNIRYFRYLQDLNKK